MNNAPDLIVITPEHIYNDPAAPYTVMPGSAYAFIDSVAAHCKGQIQHLDGNFDHFTPDRVHNQQVAPVIGLSTIGCMYAADVRELMQTIREQCLDQLGLDPQFAVGGYWTSRLRRHEFKTLFGPRTLSQVETFQLRQALGGERGPIKPKEQTAFSQWLRREPPERQKAYLEQEVSFYFSDGCAYFCTPCAAERSVKDQQGKTTKTVRRQYRAAEAVWQDLQTLAELKAEHGGGTMKLYMSCLDGLQKEGQHKEDRMLGWCQMLAAMRQQYPTVDWQWRCLATTQSTLSISDDTLAQMQAAGLSRVGLGWDGMSLQAWEAFGKVMNVSGAIKRGDVAPETKCLAACEKLRRHGVQVEGLCVAGNEGADTPETLTQLRDFCEAEIGRGAVIHTYITKQMVPGNAGWMSEDPVNQATREYLLQEPRLLQLLDFDVAATPISHPRSGPAFIQMVNDHAEAMSQLPHSGDTESVDAVRYEYDPTSGLYHVTDSAWRTMKKLNRGRYDR